MLVTKYAYFTSALLLLGLIMLAFIYHVNGPEWDLIAHYLNSKSIANAGIYANAALATNNYGTIEAAGIYFEDFRAPLSSLVMLPLTLLNSRYALLGYVMLVYLLLIWASTYLADALGMNRLVTYAAFLSPYLLYFGFIVNGTEALSAALLLFGLGLISKRSSYAGILFGLAALAKYPAMIFFPLLFLLRKPKKIFYAFLLEAIVILPWLLFNYDVFGNPLASYMNAFDIALITPFEPLYLGTILSVFWYPALLCTIAILLFYMLRFRLKPRMREKIFIPKSMAGEIVIGFLVISIVEFMLVGWHYDVFSQSRFGYLSYFGVSLAAAYMLSRINKIHRRIYGLNLGNLPFVVAAICFIVLAYYAFAFHSSMAYYNYALYNTNGAASVFSYAKSELYALGYGNCSVISNAWVPMKYVGVNAYMPQYYGIDESQYVVVSFKNVNVKPKISGYINESRPVFESKYFEILVPKNLTC
ncbi:MAG: glycosyltransferase family 87 protein [Candidatus Micrarchaeaceae archaeon]